MSQLIVILPGGFHPYHAGHFALYQSAKKAFPNADVYVAATDDQSERPFPFALKEKLAKLAGVESGHFIRVKSPFKSEEITKNYDPKQDVLVFVRSEKDRNEQPKPGGTKKDGSPSYFQPWTGKNLQPFSKHAYIAYLPTVEFGPGITSATQIRKAWPTLNDKRKLALVMSLYPAAQKNSKLAQNVVQMFDQVMGSQEVTENIDTSKISDIAKNMINMYKDSSYSAYERASGHAMNYESNDPKYKYWTQVADEIKKLTNKKVSETKKTNKQQLYWSDLDEGLSVHDKMSIFEEHYTTGNLTESNTEDNTTFFKSLIDISNTPIKNNRYITAPLLLMNNNIVMLDKPSYMEFLGRGSDGLVFRSSTGQRTYPSKAIKDISLYHVFTFKDQSSYDKFRTILSLKFDIELPPITLTNEQKINESSKIKQKYYAPSITKLLGEDKSIDYLDEK